MSAFLEGLFFGFVLALMIGPVFFILLQTSIERGVMHGLSVGFGETMSDILFLMVYYIGFTHINPEGWFTRFVGFGGVVILLVAGVLTISKARKNWKYPKTEIPDVSKKSCFLKGFMVNSFNPFVYVFWAGVMGVLKNKYAGHPQYIITFCIGIFVLKLLMDIVKAVLAGKIRSRISGPVLHRVSAGIGIILIVYAIVLFYRIVQAG